MTVLRLRRHATLNWGAVRIASRTNARGHQNARALSHVPTDGACDRTDLASFVPSRVLRWYYGMDQPMAYAIHTRDVARAADVLVASFADYPIFQYVVPDRRGRSRRLAEVFRFLVRRGLLNGEVLAPSERIEAVSIWFRSEGADSSAVTALRAGLVGLCMRVGFGVVSKLMQVSATKSRVRAELISRPYSLLDVIGVEPSLQGQGFARRMLKEKLCELDSQHLPCYLETSRMITAQYYERFGFTLVHQYRLAAMDVFCLWREISAGSSRLSSQDARRRSARAR